MLRNNSTLEDQLQRPSLALKKLRVFVRHIFSTLLFLQGLRLPRPRLETTDKKLMLTSKCCTFYKIRNIGLEIVPERSISEYYLKRDHPTSVLSLSQTRNNSVLVVLHAIFEASNIKETEKIILESYFVNDALFKSKTCRVQHNGSFPFHRLL